MSNSVWASVPHLPWTSPPLCTAHQLQADLPDYMECQGGPGCTAAELGATVTKGSGCQPRPEVPPTPPKQSLTSSWAGLYLGDVSMPFL